MASNKIRRDVFCSDTNLFLVLIFTVAVVNIQLEAHDFFIEQLTLYEGTGMCLCISLHFKTKAHIFHLESVQL